MEQRHVLSNSLRDDFDRDGFVIIRQFLPAAEFADLKKQVARYIAEVVPKCPETDAFYDDRSRPSTLKQLGRMDVDPFFRDLASHPLWVQVAEVILGAKVVSQGVEWFNKPAGTNHPTPTHQDNYYFNLTPPDVLTMWLALEDVDEENGCLRYVRASHLAGRRPHNASNQLGFSQGLADYSAQDAADEVPIILRAGDLAVHHGWTIHRADPNRSATRHRPSLAMVFRSIACQKDEEGERKYLESLQAQHAALGIKTGARG